MAAPQRPFVDTNILLYLFSPDEHKAERAAQVLAGGIVVSVQVLNEFAHVARRKMGLAWPEIGRMLADVRHFAEVRDLDLKTHEQGLALAARYQLGLYDAMIAAAALESGCRLLLSEDFQTGQVFERRLTVGNPFIS